MTTGQRIAQYRKALGLSQEALGEKLGVSRQSIYKWESDAALPEIEKLVTLSRLFGLSVGALLGVEEESAPAETGELTEAQLKLVEEITQRYLSAAPARPRRLTAALLAVAALAALLGIRSVSHRLERMESQYLYLQNSIDSVSHSVDRRVDAIAGQVTDLLKTQNDLTADYAAQVVEVDPAGGTVTFSFRATPKTFTEGTVAYLEVASPSAATTYGPYQPLENGVFIGSETVTLHDDIRLSVIFDTGGVRFTQTLAEFTGLWSDTFPKLEEAGGSLTVSFYGGTVNKDRFYADGLYGYLTKPTENIEGVDNVTFGLFYNGELLSWASASEPPEGYTGSEFASYEFYKFPNLNRTFEPGDELVIAAEVTDSYGRMNIYPLVGRVFQVDADGRRTAEYISYPDGYFESPEEWGLES